MWNYEKRLQFPIHIKNPNPALAAMIISQYGGPDGESGASMRAAVMETAQNLSALLGHRAPGGI